MLFSDRVRLGIRHVWLVSGYAHVFVPLSVVDVQYPIHIQSFCFSVSLALPRSTAVETSVNSIGCVGAESNRVGC